MNTYSIPLELAQARKQREDAWRKYNDLIDAGKTETANNFFPMVQMFEQTASRLYVEWMVAGGTSDIDSLTFPDRIPADVMVSDLVIDEHEGSDTSMSAQLNDAGYGSQGVF